VSDIATIVEAYLGMWNTTDPAARKKFIEKAWATDGRYVDPMLEADGHDALNEMVAGVQQHYVGHQFTRTSGIDAHHDTIRFAWDLRAPDGALTVAGVDVGVLDSDGKLQQITGFFGDLPAVDA